MARTKSAQTTNYLLASIFCEDHHLDPNLIPYIMGYFEQIGIDQQFNEDWILEEMNEEERMNELRRYLGNTPPGTPKK